MTARVTITIEGDALDVLHALAGLVDQTRLETSDVPAVPAASTPSASGEEDVVEEAAAPEGARSSGAAASPLTCPECGKGYRAPQGLGRHRQAVHGVAGSSKGASLAAKAQRSSAPPTAPAAEVEAPAPEPADEVEVEFTPDAFDLAAVARIVREAGPTDHTPDLVARRMKVTTRDARRLIVAARDAGHFQVVS